MNRHDAAQRPFRVFAIVALVLAAQLASGRYEALAQAVAEADPAVAAPAELALASIFSDRMVLQREIEVPIWGTAPPNADVSVTLDDQSKAATADADGKWQVEFEPLEAGGPHEILVKAGDDELRLKDVLVGDVWIASGQSNMEWSVARSQNSETEIASADWPEIRLIDVPNRIAHKPKDSFESAGWQACTPETVEHFSAVAYFFGRELHQKLNVPIGLIGCNWGGTYMETWTSREALKSSPTFAHVVDEYDAARKKKQDPAAKGRPNQPSLLFNGMVSPVIPYGIRGVIWYQGEANASRADEYAELSKLMIADWRNRWGQGDFPFLLVQLAGWEPGGDSWPLLREAQAQTLEAANTGMAVAIDIGDQKDIHPKNKQEVGARLARAALSIAYDQDIVHSGPVYREMKVDGDKASLSFDHVGGGLKFKGDSLRGFQIAGADGKFVPAEARIDGVQVVVSSPDVQEPKAVRYNWAAFPDGNLYNVEDLPAVPFRTNPPTKPAP